jgi:mannose-6-phosphate isomerase-like protein (cupin superfamily)
MAYAGQVIQNPLSGERITFRRPAAETNGEPLAIDLELSPDRHVPGMHVHPIQEERFEVVKGTMRFKLGGKPVIARAGDVVVVPPGVRHKIANGGDEKAHVRVEVRPALQWKSCSRLRSRAPKTTHDPHGHAEAARPGAVRQRVRKKRSAAHSRRSRSSGPHSPRSPG